MHIPPVCANPEVRRFAGPFVEFVPREIAPARRASHAATPTPRMVELSEGVATKPAHIRPHTVGPVRHGSEFSFSK